MDRCDAFDHPQPGGRGTAVDRSFGLGRPLGDPADDADGLDGVAHAGQVVGALAGTGGDREAFLGDPVLPRVVRQHGDAAAGLGGVDGLVDRVGQGPEFVVDLDADRLERALGGVAAGPPGRSRDRGGASYLPGAVTMETA